MSWFLFLIVMDWTMRKKVWYGESGLKWKLKSKPDNLENDGNVALTWAPEGRWKKGRPRTTWRRTAEKEKK